MKIVESSCIWSPFALRKNAYSGDAQNYFDGISAVDASRIARHVGNNYHFNEYQKLAANILMEYELKSIGGSEEDENQFIFTFFEVNFSTKFGSLGA